MVLNSDLKVVDHVDLWLIVVMMEDFLIGPWKEWTLEGIYLVIMSRE